MNFLQKYDLKVSTRFGKNYVTVEDAAHIVHELEQTIQFLNLEVNRFHIKYDMMQKHSSEKIRDHKTNITYYRESRDKAWNETSETRSKYLNFKSKYKHAKLTIFYLLMICIILSYKLVLGN